jgi:hypothetical protein
VHYVRSLFLILSAALVSASCFADNRPPADAWVTNQAQYPGNVFSNSVHLSGFETLHAEVVTGRLMLLWQPAHPDSNTIITLFLSVDDLGHWPVRDWHAYPMSPSGNYWQARRPVDNIDVPIVYFLQTVTAGTTNLSPMRLCHPKILGLEMPSRPFWPFLEGFEQGTESWRLVPNSIQHPGLTIDPIAKNGYCSLKVSLLASQRSVTVATTRLRGWQIQQKGALGLRLWLRTKTGIGQARFTLYSNAQTTNQISAVSSLRPQLNDQWQKIDLPFSDFPKVALTSVDWFTIEFSGTGGIDLLIDDLLLLGPWGNEPD